MAIFHMRSQTIDRSKGRSVVAAAAYRAGDNLWDERYEENRNFTRKRSIVHSEIFLPEGAPKEFRNRETLWNAVEKSERRKDAQLAREIEVALPRELNEADRLELVRSFVQENFVALGMIADVSIHCPIAADNKIAPHAHILLTMRPVSESGFGPKKERLWNSKKVYEYWRTSWEDLTNGMLAVRGIDARIDRRSYADRGIDLEPQIKEGAARPMQGRVRENDPHFTAERTAKNEQIQARNWHRITVNPRIVVDALTDKAASFTEQDVARYLHRWLGEDMTEEQTRLAFDTMKARVLASDETVLLGKDEEGNERYSSRSLLRAERDLVDMADKMQGDRSHGDAIAHQNDVLSYSKLSGEQAAAVRHVTGPERLALVSGLAGTGKTTMLDEAAYVWSKGGYQVRGLTLSATAAQQLEDGATIRSQTIAQFFWRLNNLKPNDEAYPRLNAKTVLVVDEAGMVGSRQMRDVLAVAQQYGAKVVAVGDAEQLQPIQAGAPFRVLEARLGAARMVDVRRARNADDREATVALGSGRPRDALEYYDRKGALREVASSAQVVAETARAYLADAAEIGGENVLVLAHRRADIREINKAIRSELVKSGEVKEGVTFETALGERAFGEGDRIVFLKNNRALGVRNGLDGVVESVRDDLLTVRTKDRTVAVRVSGYKHIDHGYARTVHKGQGATAERVHGVLSSSMDRQLLYVLLSRHRDTFRGYWTPETAGNKEKLFERLSRDRRKDSTIDYAEVRGFSPPFTARAERFTAQARQSDLTEAPSPKYDPQEAVQRAEAEAQRQAEAAKRELQQKEEYTRAERQRQEAAEQECKRRKAEYEAAQERERAHELRRIQAADRRKAEDAARQREVEKKQRENEALVAIIDRRLAIAEDNARFGQETVQTCQAQIVHEKQKLRRAHFTIFLRKEAIDRQTTAVRVAEQNLSNAMKKNTGLQEVAAREQEKLDAARRLAASTGKSLVTVRAEQELQRQATEARIEHQKQAAIARAALEARLEQAAFMDKRRLEDTTYQVGVAVQRAKDAHGALRKVGRAFFKATEKGSSEDARRHLSQALQSPDFARAWGNLQKATERLGAAVWKMDEAAGQCDRREDPSVVRAEERAARVGYELEAIPGRDVGQDFTGEASPALQRVVDRYREDFRADDRQRVREREQSRSRNAGPSMEF